MRSRFFGLVAPTIVLIFIASSATVALGADKPTKTITGVVKRFEVKNGKIQSVYIKDADQGDYLVLRGTDKSKELAKLVGSTVKATGYVREAKREPEFSFVLDILEFEKIEPATKPLEVPKTD